MIPAMRTPTDWFDLHWANDQELYRAVLAHATDLLTWIPRMTPEALGLNIVNACQRWVSDGRVTFDRPDSVLGLTVMTHGSPTREVLDTMDREVEWSKINWTEVGEQVVESLGGEDVMATVNAARRRQGRV
jgi:hypothetical protein